MQKTKDAQEGKKVAVLGYSKVIKADTVVRAGCTKSYTHTCGISYRTS